ncbi:MAG: VWA domain-containing protein, partial [Planctomycetota bacterium]
MSKSSSLRAMFRGVAVAGLVAVSSAWSFAAVDFAAGGDFPPEGASRLATFDNSTGETSFALSLTPQFKQGGTLPSDVVIYVDTSASQTGLYKRDSLELVSQLLSNLSAEDRVKVVAVDIDSVVLTESFVAPGATELEAALKQLNDRVPLGSTDLVGMLKSSTTLFGENANGRNQSIIYIGDGLSRGGLMHDRKFSAVVSQLSDAHVTFSSYAIGPERDIESLAALANQLGGNVFLDSDEANVIDNAATALADTVHGLVFWPGDAKFSESITEFLPQQFPPMRADRDTILIGNLSARGPVTISVAGEVNGVAETMSWTVTAENSSEDFAFLPKLIDSARGNGGLTLPTIGSAGLREAARMLSDGSRTLSQLGSSALLSGNFTAAQKIADEALAADPANTEAEALKEAAVEAATNGLNLPQEEVAPPQEQAEKAPAQQEGAPQVESSQGSLQLIGPGAQDNEVQGLIQENLPQVNDLAGQETERQRVIEERAKAEVRFTLGRVMEELRTDPASAIERLKGEIDVIDKLPDLSPEVRADLRGRLESALMSS